MNRQFVLAALFLTGTLLAAESARAMGQSDIATPKRTVPAERVSADKAYKSHCTRCHSELPKLDARGMKTVVMHMRVRAKIPDDQARAILAYLTR